MIQCLKCGEVAHILKAGLIRGKQRYFCKSCNWHFTIPDPDAVDRRRKINRQTTIVDIARELGIASSTVSRALHAHPDINAETRRIILETAARMDYQPNKLAYNLAKSQTNLIGIIVPEFNNQFFPNVIIGAHDAVTQAGYSLMIMQSNESYATEVANARAMLENRVDGILLSLAQETNNYDHLVLFEKRGIPLVLFNRVTEGLTVPHVVVNDFEASFLVVEHLIQNGYERIAHLGGPLNLLVSRERLRGYKAALRKYGMPVEESYIIHGDLTPHKVRIYGQYLLDQEKRPDAIFALNDPMAIELLLIAREKGIRVPQELGIVGFSDDKVSRFIEPGLTTIRQPTVEMGRVAARILLDLVGNPEVEVPAHTVLSTELVVRASSLKGNQEPWGSLTS